MSRNELQGLLNQVNNVALSNTDGIKEYISLVKLCADKLSTMQQEDKNPVLDVWLRMGIEEIQKDITGRLGSNFDNLSPERQRTELMYSKSTIAMSLTNIMMHL